MKEKNISPNQESKYKITILGGDADYQYLLYAFESYIKQSFSSALKEFVDALKANGGSSSDNQSKTNISPNAGKSYSQRGT